MPVTFHFGGSFSDKYLLIFIQANLYVTLVNLITLDVDNHGILEFNVLPNAFPFDSAGILNENSKARDTEDKIEFILI